MWKYDVAVPLRDLCVLKCDIWLPHAEGVGNRPALPVLLYRTPYCKRNAPSEWTVFEKICASNVFALCIMDVRGRYESDGEFCPYFQETNDGYDCIEWCARQDFCNGRVATFGISYPAAWQQLACCQGRPPHLVACIPAFSYSKPSSFIYFGDVFDSSWAWWTLTCIAPNVRVKKGLLGPKTDEEAEEHFEREKGRICSTLPLMNIPDMKHVADWYYSWLQHGPRDSFWDAIDLTGKIPAQLPTLYMSGWYDEAYGPGGAIANFLQQPQSSWLIIGPWTHGSPEDSKAGDFDFGPAANTKFVYDDLVINFLGHFLIGGGYSIPQSRVNVFLMGKNEWLEFESWPPAHSSVRAALASEGILRLNGAPEEIVVASVFSDPRFPVKDPFASSYGAHDYSELLNRKDDRVAVFTLELEEDLVIVGFIKVSISFRTSAKSLDLWTRIYDNGRNICQPGSDLQRWIRKDDKEVQTVVLDQMVTANAFKRGLLQLAVSASWHPHFSVNLQTGESEHVSSETCSTKFEILGSSFVDFPKMNFR